MTTVFITPVLQSRDTFVIQTFSWT